MTPTQGPAAVAKSLNRPALPARKHRGVRSTPRSGGGSVLVGLSHRLQLPRYWVVGWVACVVLRFASAQTAIVAYLGLAFLASKGRAFAVLGLATSMVFTMLNPQIAPVVPAKSILRYAVLLGATLGTWWAPSATRRASDNGVIGPTWVVLLLLCSDAIVVSPYPTLSALKALSFGFAILTLLAAWTWMGTRARAVTEQALFLFLACISFSSVVLALFPQGYFLGGSLCGVFGHPQTLGPFAGIVATLACVRCLTMRPVPRFDLGLLFSCLFLIFRSKARTGAMAFLGGTGATLLLASGAGLGAARARLVSAVGGLALAGALVLGPGATSEVDSFIRKDSGASSIGEIARSSRGGLIDTMLGNFWRSPLTGIGFGAPSVTLTEGMIEYDPVFGLPTSAAIEKGVMPMAVLEELGLPLATIVFLWMLLMGRRALQAGPLPTAAFAAAISSNFSESTFFSFGGMGLLVMILVSWSATAPPLNRKIPA